MNAMISLSTGAFYDRATRQIGSLRAEADDLQRQIGSGERLSRSSDDPVAAAQLRTLSREQRLAEVDQRNSDLAQNNLKLTDDALDQVSNVLIRAKELATAAANGTLSDDQRNSIGTEIESLRQSLLLIANSRDGAGHEHEAGDGRCEMQYVLRKEWEDENAAIEAEAQSEEEGERGTEVAVLQNAQVNNGLGVGGP